VKSDPFVIVATLGVLVLLFIVAHDISEKVVDIRKTVAQMQSEMRAERQVTRAERRAAPDPGPTPILSGAAACLAFGAHCTLSGFREGFETAEYTCRCPGGGYER